MDLSDWLRDITAALATALAYFFCAFLGLFFVFGHEGIAALWPGSGVFCAAMVINRGRRLWLVVLFTALADFAAAYWINRTPLVLSVCFTAIIASESALAAWVLVRLRGRTLGFGNVGDVLALALGASSVPAVGGFIAAAIVHAVGGEPLWENWYVWWLADGVGMLAVAPVILAWRAHGWGALRVSNRGRALEVAMFFGVLVGALCLVFGAGHNNGLKFPYPIFPLLVWAGLRLGPHGAGTAVFIMAALAVAQTVNGHGPFGGAFGTMEADLLNLQGFIAVTVFSTMILAAVVTERGRMQRALGQGEAQMRLLTDALPVAISYVDSDERYRFNNAAFESQFGIARSAVHGRTIREALPERIYQTVGPQIRAALAGQETRFKFTLPTPGTGARTFDVHYVPDFANDGSVLGLYIVSSDLTEHEEAEHASRESEAKFRGVVESVPGGIAMVDAAGRIVLVNREMEVLFGYTREELLGRRIEMLVPERYRQSHRALRASYLSAPVPRRIGQGRFLTGLRKDGTEVAVEIGLAPVETEQETQVLAVITDVTRIRQAEAALKESELRFRTVCDTAPVMIWMSSPDKLCAYFNQPWLGFTGRSLVQELGTGWCEGVHPDDLAHCLDTYQSAFDARRSFTMEYRLRRADGEYRWLLDHGVPRFDPEGRFLGYIGSCVDVTEKRALEERAQQQQAELAHVQRLAAVGETAAALAHEINQPLAAIVSYVEGASLRFQNEIGANPALGEMLHQTGRIARRAGDVVRNLRGFARKSDGTFGPVHINQAVREAVQLLEPQATRRALGVRMKLAHELPAVSGDHVQIEQLLVNLLGNGLEAMQDTAGGVRDLTITTGLTADRAVEICIRDSGPGIDASAREHLFTPFFTTKEKGLGIGLTVCRSIVERHGGRIWAEEGDGSGALFHVVLPSAQQEAQNGD